MIEAAVEITVAHTKTRQAFGKPLFALQNTRRELAECATIAEVVRTSVDDAVGPVSPASTPVPTRS